MESELRAAVAPGGLHTEKVEGTHLLHRFPGEPPFFVDLLGDGRQLRLGELSRHLPDLFLLDRKREVHLPALKFKSFRFRLYIPEENEELPLQKYHNSKRVRFQYAWAPNPKRPGTMARGHLIFGQMTGPQNERQGLLCPAFHSCNQIILIVPMPGPLV